MIKKNYEAPEVEQMVIRFEENIMSTRAATAPDMTKHDSSDWGDWE